MPLFSQELSSPLFLSAFFLCLATDREATMAFQNTKQAKAADERAASKVAERKDMLILAQQKLDEINRGNLGLSSGPRPSSSSAASRRTRGRRSAVSCHLLSTLLYVALMAHKLEDMKAMLAEEDGDAYDEWHALLSTLHSPEFHVRERVAQNRRARRTFERKRRYKEEATRLRGELAEESERLRELQKLSNETNHQLSKTINVLQEERATLVAKDEERRDEMAELNDTINELRREAEKNDIRIHSLECEVEKNDQSLEDKDQIISGFEEELSRYKQESAIANTTLNHARTTLEETNVKLEASERRHDEYRAEQEPVISQLQQGLTEAQISNATLSARLAAADESLDDARQKLEDDKKTIASMSASFNKLEVQSNDLRDMVQNRMSKIDGGMVRTESMLEASNGHLEKVLVHNNAVDGSFADASKELSDQTASLKRRLDAVDGVVSTLSRAESLETFSGEIQRGVSGVKQTLDDVLKHQQSGTTTTLQDLSNVAQRLEGISESLQQHSTRQEIANLQQSLGELSERQKLGSTSQELSSVEQRLEELSNRHRTTLAETNARLEASEAKQAEYRSKKEPMISQLQQELVESQTSNAELSARLVAANESLDDAQRKLEDDKKTIETSFGELKVQSNELKIQSNDLRDLQHDLRDIVQGRMSNLDDGVSQANGHLEKVLAHNDAVDVSFAVASRELAKQTASLECRLDAVDGAISVLSSAESLERVSGETQQGVLGVKQTLGDVSEHQRSGTAATHQDLSSVAQRLDGISQRLQQNSTHQELADVQQRLDCISELQRRQNDSQELSSIQRSLDELSALQQDDSLHGNLLDVQQKLNDISELQQQNDVRQELASVQQSLDELSKRQRSEAAGVAAESESNVQLLHKISQSIDGVCDKCSRMETAIYESNCDAEQLLETICNTINGVSDQCVAINSDVKKALSGARTSKLEGSARDLGMGIADDPAEPGKSPSRIGTASTRSMSASAGELVDNFVSEAVSRLD